jgi:dTDP-4-dehydrorhamnose reductase
MEGVSYVCGSVLDVYMIEKILKDFDVDVVIHCAALTNMDACEQDPNYAEIVNTVMSSNLACASEKYGVKMVYISSDSVYPGTKAWLYAEDEFPAPISVYAKTKLMGEETTLRYPRNLVVRTNLYGFNYRDKESFGEWVINALAQGKDLMMFDDLYFSPILVNRLSDLIMTSIDFDLKGLFNICCTGRISKYDLGCEIKEQFGLPGNIVRSSMKDHRYIAPRTQNMGMDNKLIRETLSIDIPTAIEDVKLFKVLYERGYPSRLKEGR